MRIDATNTVRMRGDDTVRWDGYEVQVKPNLFSNLRKNGVVLERFAVLGPGDVVEEKDLRITVDAIAPAPPVGPALVLPDMRRARQACALSFSPARHLVHLRAAVAIVEVGSGRVTRLSLDEARAQGVIVDVVDDPRPRRPHVVGGRPVV